MSQERAGERFFRLLYSHLQAFPSDSRDRAWRIVAENHKALYAEYQAETAAENATAEAANGAAEAAKTKAANERRARMGAVNNAVEEAMRKGPHLDYQAAYAKVQREQPGLFTALQGPASVQATNVRKG